jgi:hypothetical protein
MNEEHKPEESAKGSLVPALIFFVIFVLIYFVNFKYLASVWHIE